MHLWSDISRDDEFKVLSVVVGCYKCAERGLYTDIAESRAWLKRHNLVAHELSNITKVDYVGEPALGSKKARQEANKATSEAVDMPEATTTPDKEIEPLERLIQPFYGEAKLLQGFGDNADVYKRFGFQGHMGNDYGLIMQPVLASHDAVVEYSGDGGEWPIMGSAAGTCILLRGETVKTGYAHLERSYMTIGDSVKAGDVIGISGSTGATTGPHLHWEVLTMPYQHGNGYAGRVDPTPYLYTPTPIGGTP